MSRNELITRIEYVAHFLHGVDALVDLHNFDTSTLRSSYYAFLFELKLHPFQINRFMHNGQRWCVYTGIN